MASDRKMYLCSVDEVDGLTEAKRIISRLQLETVYCKPAWQNIYNIEKYLTDRQNEVLAEVLSDPDEQVSGS